MRASVEPPPPPDARDLRYDAAAAQFAAPLARIARAFEDEQPGRSALQADLHLAMWHGLADYDTAVPLRAWVFRDVLQAVATHEPNSHDKDVRNLPVKVVWAQGRLLRAQRGLAEIPAPARSATELLLALKPLDRELALLFLEGIGTEEAAWISGRPSSQLLADFERIGGLLPARAREEWQQLETNVVPVSREFIRLRQDELRNRKRRNARIQFRTAMAVAAVTLANTLFFYRGRWMTMAGMLMLVGLIFFEGWQARRKGAEPEARSPRRPHSLALHRDLLSSQRDELRRSYSWQAWWALCAVFVVVLGFPLRQVTTWTWALGLLALLVLVLVLTRLRNLREAKQLQARLDSL